MFFVFLFPGIILPRVTIVLLWLFTSWFSGMFSGAIIPVLGFFFLPYTLLWYSVVVRMFNGEWGFWQLAILLVAVMFDVAPAASERRRRRHA